MGKFALKIIEEGGEELYYTGEKYRIGKDQYADTAEKLYAKSFASYVAARKKCHEVNKSCRNGNFTVTEI